MKNCDIKEKYDWLKIQALKTYGGSVRTLTIQITNQILKVKSVMVKA